MEAIYQPQSTDSPHALQAAQDAMDAEALDAVDMDDMSTGSLADWSSEDFGADGSSSGFISVSGYADEFPRDGRGFEPSMLVSQAAAGCC